MFDEYLVATVICGSRLYRELSFAVFAKIIDVAQFRVNETLQFARFCAHECGVSIHKIEAVESI
jgi:hypothetical protein